MDCPPANSPVASQLNALLNRSQILSNLALMKLVSSKELTVSDGSINVERLPTVT